MDDDIILDVSHSRVSAAHFFGHEFYLVIVRADLGGQDLLGLILFDYEGIEIGDELLRLHVEFNLR